MNKEDTLPTIKIKRIKEVGFSIQESLIKQYPDKLIKIEIDQQFGFSIDYNMVELNIRIYYYHSDAPQNLLAEINVHNIFEIPELKEFQNNDREIKLPRKMITNIVGTSISHTRALLAQHLAGTSLQTSLPVLVDSEDIARHFFPGMFDDPIAETATNK